MKSKTYRGKPKNSEFRIQNSEYRNQNTECTSNAIDCKYSTKKFCNNGNNGNYYSFSRLAIIIISLVLILQTLNTPVVLAAEKEAAVQTQLPADYLDSVYSLILSKYNDPVSIDDLSSKTTLKDIFGSLDPYTAFYTPDEAQVFFESINGSYVGIGISMEKKDEYIVITKVFSGSPAEKSGIFPGDTLISADGKSLKGATPEQAREIIIGNEGTEVKIEVMRNGHTGNITFVIKRQRISINPVYYEIKSRNIGYLRIEMFNSNVKEYLDKAIMDFDKNRVKKVILDLRNNGGGLVDQAVSACQYFVPKGLVTKLDFKSQEEVDFEYYSELKQPKYKLVVLINGQSASASEIMAGAIQDTGAGKLVGSKSFGKSKVQSLLPLLTPQSADKYFKLTGARVVNAYDLINKYNMNPFMNELIGWTKITTGMYLTPKGRKIDGAGLLPDISLPDPKPLFDMDLYSINKLSRTGTLYINSESTDVLSAEKILKVSGYKIDTPDTKFDQVSAVALKAFQKSNHLFQSGILDSYTQKFLNIQLEKLLVSNDKQYAKAWDIIVRM